MRFNRNNPWLIAIIGGAIGAILASIAIYKLGEYARGKAASAANIDYISDADSLLEKNMPDEALAKYNDVLKKVSVKKDPELYAHIKSRMGICYYNFAKKSDKEENLKKAIRAYEASLEISTVEKYPLDYEITMSNMEKAKEMMGE